MKRAAASPPDPLLPDFVVGAWVLLWNPETAHSLEPAYQGPYRIKLVEDNGFGKPTGWFTIAEIMAGDSEETPREAKPIEVHSSRLWPFNHSRTSATLEHQRRLPPGQLVVEDILEGPDADGRFLVKWFTVETPKWEWPAGLAHLTVFKEFCGSHGIVMQGERAVTWRPSTLPAQADLGGATVPGYSRCACGKMVKEVASTISQHLKSKRHIAALEALAAAAAPPAPAVVQGGARLVDAPVGTGGAGAPSAGGPRRASSRARRG